MIQNQEARTARAQRVSVHHEKEIQNESKITRHQNLSGDHPQKKSSKINLPFWNVTKLTSQHCSNVAASRLPLEKIARRFPAATH